MEIKVETLLNEECQISVNHKLMVKMVRSIKPSVSKVYKLTDKGSIINKLGYVSRGGKTWYWWQDGRVDWNSFTVLELWELYKQLIK